MNCIRRSRNTKEEVQMHNRNIALFTFASVLALSGLVSGCSDRDDAEDSEQGHVLQHQTDTLRSAQELGKQVEEEEKRKQDALEDTRQ